MNPRWADAQEAFLRAWSAIADPCPRTTAPGEPPDPADWIKAAWGGSAGGEPAFAEAYRRFGEWVGAAIAGTRGGSTAASAVCAMVDELKKHIDELLARSAAEAPEIPLSPWARLADVFGGRWPPDGVFAQTWSGLSGFPDWHGRLQDVSQAWLRQRAAAIGLHCRHLASFKDALDRFGRRIVDDGDDEETITTLKSLFALWVECAEEAHREMLVNAHYGREFGVFVNAGGTLRRAAADAIADFFTALGLPIRGGFAGAQHPSSVRADKRDASSPMADVEHRVDDTLRETPVVHEQRTTAEAWAAETRARAPAGSRRATAPRAVPQKQKRRDIQRETAPTGRVKTSSRELRGAPGAGGEFDIAAIALRRR